MYCNFDWDGGVVQSGDQWQYECSECGNPQTRGAKVKVIRPCNSPRREPCVHLRPSSGEVVSCGGCPGSKRVHAIMGCDLYGKCVPFYETDDFSSFRTCHEYEAEIT